MGRGDIKTRRGKIANGSFGARRKRKIKKRRPSDVKVGAAKNK
jgi:30S ribosomal protein S31